MSVLNDRCLGSTLEILTRWVWDGAQASVWLGSSPGDSDERFSLKKKKIKTLKQILQLSLGPGGEQLIIGSNLI